MLTKQREAVATAGIVASSCETGCVVASGQHRDAAAGTGGRDGMGACYGGGSEGLRLCMRVGRG